MAKKFGKFVLFSAAAAAVGAVAYHFVQKKKEDTDFDENLDLPETAEDAVEAAEEAVSDVAEAVEDTVAEVKEEVEEFFDAN